MNYARHLWVNWKVGARCALLAAFHIAHGIVPVRWTSHEWWGVVWSKKG